MLAFPMKKACEWIRAQGREVVSVREPGSTPVGERVRDVVLHAQEIPLAPNAPKATARKPITAAMRRAEVFVISVSFAC